MSALSHAGLDHGRTLADLRDRSGNRVEGVRNHARLGDRDAPIGKVEQIALVQIPAHHRRRIEHHATGLCTGHKHDFHMADTAASEAWMLVGRRRQSCTVGVTVWSMPSIGSSDLWRWPLARVDPPPAVWIGRPGDGGDLPYGWSLERDHGPLSRSRFERMLEPGRHAARERSPGDVDLHHLPLRYRPGRCCSHPRRWSVRLSNLFRSRDGRRAPDAEGAPPRIDRNPFEPVATQAGEGHAHPDRRRLSRAA